MGKQAWTKIFIELAVRAVMQVHHKYSVWELGQEELVIDDFKRLNQGLGIFFAPEVHVRDTISQQIIETALWKEHKIEGENRSYLVDREFPIKIPLKELVLLDEHNKLIINKEIYENDYLISDKVTTFNIDLIFKRIQINNGDRTPTRPVLIEAKRYNLIDIDLIKKTVTQGEIQKRGIDKDILKLRAIRKFNLTNKINFYGNEYDKIFTYLLIWGKGNNDINFDIEKELINKLDYSIYIDKENIEIRRIPLSWSNDTIIMVKSFIWIALIPLNEK